MRLQGVTNGARRGAFRVGRRKHAGNADDIGADRAVGLLLEHDGVVARHDGPRGVLIPASLRIRFAKPVPTSFFVWTVTVMILFVEGFQN